MKFRGYFRDHLQIILKLSEFKEIDLTLSRQRPLSYRNQSIDFRSKSMDWFLYDVGLRLERVNRVGSHTNCREKQQVDHMIDVFVSFES